MKRTAGTYAISTTLGEAVQAFVPHPLPPAEPALAPEVYAGLNHRAELALARLSGVSGLVPSVGWLLYSTIRKEALLTSQIEGTQATLTDLFDEEAGFAVRNTDDVEEITSSSIRPNITGAFRSSAPRATGSLGSRSSSKAWRQPPVTPSAASSPLPV